MEEISNLILSLKNKSNIIGEMESYQKNQIENLKKDLSAFNSEIENLKGIITEKESKIIEKQKTIKDLDKEINSLESNNSQLNSNLLEKTSIKDKLEKENMKLDTDLEKLEIHIESTTTSISELQKLVTERKNELEKITNKLEGIKIDHENSIASFRDKYNKTKKNLENIKALNKATKFFINEKLLKTPEMAIIESLTGKDQINIDYIQKTTLSKIDVIQSTIKALEKRGVLEYEPNVGQIKMKKIIQI